MRTFFIVGGVLLVVGVLVLVVCFVTTGLQPGRFTLMKYEHKNYTTQGNVDSVVLNDRNAHVVLGVSSDENIHVAYCENEKETYRITEQGGLVIQKEYHYKWYDALRWNGETPVVTILLPSNFTGNVSVDSGNGKIEAEDISLNNLHVTTSNGQIKLRTISAKGEIEAKTSNGKVEIMNSSATRIIGKTSNGKVNLQQLQADEIRGETSNGAITLVDLQAKDSAQFESNNAQITVDNVESPQLTLKTSNGRVTGTLPGSISDYTIESKTSNGKNNLPTQIQGGSKKLVVKNSNGEINIQFAQQGN